MCAVRCSAGSWAGLDLDFEAAGGVAKGSESSASTSSGREAFSTSLPESASSSSAVSGVRLGSLFTDAVDVRLESEMRFCFPFSLGGFIDVADLDLGLVTLDVEVLPLGLPDFFAVLEDVPAVGRGGLNGLGAIL